MKKRAAFFLISAVLILIALPVHVEAQEGDSLPPLGDLVLNEWNQLEPGGDTICATGAPYSFFVRPAAPDRLLIMFGGGGSCWTFEYCDPASSPTYIAFPNTLNTVAFLGGILDRGNPRNPFAGYSVITIPICTGDNHIGFRETTYRAASTDDNAEAREVTIFHYGYVNVMAALNWAFENFDSPTHIFVTGSSAGGVAAPFYGGIVAEHYPDAHLAVLGDSAGGFRFGAANAAIMESWGTVDILPDWPEYAGITAENLFNETFYIASANRFPNVVFAEYNSAHDEQQYFGLSLVGITGTPLPDILHSSYTEIREATPGNFFTYTAGGSKHGILPTSSFYSYQVDGVGLRDWVAALAAGEEINDVMCTDCDEMELYFDD